MVTALMDRADDAAAGRATRVRARCISIIS
jgi:hypothetical protein